MPILKGSTIADIARDLAPHAPICFFCREPIATPDHRVKDCAREWRHTG